MGWENLLVSAVIQALVGLLIYVAVRRPMDQVGELKKQVADLKDNRIQGIEADLEEHAKGNVSEFEKGAARRKDIYERLAKIEREAVTQALCREQHVALVESLQEYRSAVIDLAKVQESVAATARFVNEVNERVIGVMQDVAALKGARQ